MKRYFNKVANYVKISLCGMVSSLVVISIIVGEAVISEAVIAPATYVIYTDGVNIYAQNGQTGVNDFSGTDASIVIQSAINAVPSTGGKIFIKEGTYTINSMLSITKDFLTIEGVGTGDMREGPTYRYGQTVLYAPSSLPNSPDPDHPNGVILKIQQPSGFGNVRIENLKLVGANPNTGPSGIWVYASVNVELRHLLLTYVYTGIEFFNCGASKTSDVWIRAFGSGYTCFGMFLRGSTDQDLHRVVVEGTGALTQGVGIFLNGSPGNKIRECHAATSLTGILLDGASRVNNISGSFIDYNRKTGVLIANESNNIIVENCRVSNNGEANTGSIEEVGVRVYASNNVLVTGNMVEDFDPTPTQQYGIYEHGTSNNNYFADNMLIGNVVAGVYKTGANTIVKNNHGYRTENGGVASVANGGTIAHGLVGTPTECNVTATVAMHIVVVTAVNGTNLTIGLHNYNGSAITTPENVRWHAEYHP